MTDYLKKKKMYELLKQLEPEFSIPIMKECKYRFFRGSEWLSIPVYETLECDYIEMYHSKSCITVTFYIWDDESERLISIDRKVYCFSCGKCTLQYKRAV